MHSDGPGTHVVVPDTGAMTTNALRTVAQPQKREERVVVGGDAIADALAAVRDGRLDATIFQDAKGQGAAAVETAVKIIRKQPYEKEAMIPFQLVTKENVGKFM